MYALYIYIYVCVCVILCHISYGLIFEPACFTIFDGLFLWRNLMKSSGFSACEAPRAPRLKIEAVRKFLDLAAQVPCASTGCFKVPSRRKKIGRPWHRGWKISETIKT